ncbi:hypothetical protein [Flavobacterium sp.]|uniref:hypothetical protein n=1 Tax=Flavobacterium sp. TaxID=239 RepID=UPI004047EAA7
MKNSILKLSGAQELSKREQKTVVGGITQEMAACLSRGCVMSSASPGLGWVRGCGGSNRIWCRLEF